jgi:hypothetical protein
MSKEQLIHQVLNEKQTDLYLFWAMKLLKEYPEYKQKVLDNWGFENVNDDVLEIYNNDICSRSYNKYFCYYTNSSDLETDLFLNSVLRKEGYE